MAIKYKNKNQQVKRLVIVICVIAAFILAVLYFYRWHQVSEQEKYLNSYLTSTNTITYEMKDIGEIDTVLSETSSYYFVYIGYTGDEKVYNLEKELKPVIDKYNLHNYFYFINVTDIKDKNKNYMKDIADKLNISSNKISKVPIILFFKDGKLMQDGVYTADELKDLIEKQNVDAR